MTEPAYGLVERAFQLAPECKSLDGVRYWLNKEGYTNIDAHLSSAVLRASLKDLLLRSGN